MRILAVGLNHKSAPISVRERLSMGDDEVAAALALFKQGYPEGEFAILSTCNRVELYAASRTENCFTAEDLAVLLGRCRGVDVADFKQYLYVQFDAEAVTHLLTVGASLDSMVVGEPQIIAQVKECYTNAVAAGTTGKVLNRLFHHAFSTSKEIYSSTTITNRRVSVAGVAVDLARQLFADIRGAGVLVIGAGDMSGLLVEHLRHVGTRQITVVNRSYERACKLAQQYGMAAEPWERMESLLIEADIVVAAAAVRDYLLSRDEMRSVVRKRRKDALLIIDIAVPRNFEPAVSDLPGVYLYSVDDLAEVARQNTDLREGEMDRAVEIICAKVAEFMEWLDAMDIGPLVGQIREAFQRIGRNEMERFFVGPRAEASCRATLDATVNRVVNRLLHCVIANLNTVAREQGPEQAAKLAEDIVRQTRQIREGREPAGQ